MSPRVLLVGLWLTILIVIPNDAFNSVVRISPHDQHPTPGAELQDPHAGHDYDILVNDWILLKQSL